jgi:hypothetical protein
MKKWILGILLILVIVLAGTVYAGEQSSSAIRYILNADTVFKVITRVGYMTVLEFPSTVDEVYCGDLGAFGVEAVGKRIVVKAYMPDCKTNMIVSIGTSKRYIFELIESSTEEPNYLVTLIDPERGLNFPVLTDSINKALEGDSVYITEINRVCQVEALRTRFSVIRLMRDARKDLSVVWLRIYNALKQIDDQKIQIKGFNRIAVITETLSKDEVFTRNYQDIYVVVAGTKLTDRFEITIPWDGNLITFSPADLEGKYYEPNNATYPNRKFRVWVDEFSDATTGTEIVVPGHYDHFVIQNYVERGEIIGG